MKYKVGENVKCTIINTIIKDAKLQKFNGNWYICQNKKDGSKCRDRLGYYYSWCINSGNKEDLECNEVYNLRLARMSQYQELKYKGIIK